MTQFKTLEIFQDGQLLLECSGNLEVSIHPETLEITIKNALERKYPNAIRIAEAGEANS